MNEIAKLIFEPTTGNQVLDMVRGPFHNNTKVVDYSMLQSAVDINDLFGDSNAIILMYLGEPQSGHWTGLIRWKRNVTFFDSYGIPPDLEMDWIPKQFRKVAGMERAFLSALLSKHIADGGTCDYNAIQLQSKQPGVATCGRWVASFISHPKVPIDEFGKIYKKIARELNVSTDELVTFETS